MPYYANFFWATFFILYDPLEFSTGACPTPSGLEMAKTHHCTIWYSIIYTQIVKYHCKDLWLKVDQFLILWLKAHCLKEFLIQFLRGSFSFIKCLTEFYIEAPFTQQNFLAYVLRNLLLVLHTLGDTGFFRLQGIKVLWRLQFFGVFVVSNFRRLRPKLKMSWVCPVLLYSKNCSLHNTLIPNLVKPLLNVGTYYMEQLD